MMEPSKIKLTKQGAVFLTNNNVKLSLLLEFPVVPFPDECPSLEKDSDVA